MRSELKRAHASYTLPPLAEIVDEVWARLRGGVEHRHEPFRLPVLANADAQGAAHARTVVLRFADAGRQQIGCHTDVRSPKVAQLREGKGLVTWLFYDRERRLQLRASGPTRVHHLDDIARAAWDEVPVFSRSCYMGPIPPSQSLLLDQDPSTAVVTQPQPDDDPEAGWPNFAVLRTNLTSCDVLHLSSKGHRRARFDPRDTASTLRWVAP